MVKDDGREGAVAKRRNKNKLKRLIKRLHDQVGRSTLNRRKEQRAETTIKGGHEEPNFSNT